MKADEYIRDRLERSVAPVEVDAVFERLSRRKRHREALRKVRSGALVVAVVVGSAATFLLLTKAFRTDGGRPGDTTPTDTPRNGVIVYSRVLPTGGTHLFALDPSTSDVRRLTPEGNATYLESSISPDGRTIAVVHTIPSFDPGEAVIATIPIEGGSPTWLTDPGPVTAPAWSPDGTAIAFARSEPPYGIYVMGADGRGVQLIPGTDDVGGSHPTWSPDGSRLAFDAGERDVPSDATLDIYTVGVDGSGLTNVTRTSQANEGWPDWSWTADRIAFTRSVSTDGIFTIAPDGTDERRLTDGVDVQPSWAPDGTSIVFSGFSPLRPQGLWTVSADGSEVVAITEEDGLAPKWQPLPTKVPSDSAPARSPDAAETAPADIARSSWSPAPAKGPCAGGGVEQADIDGDGVVDRVYHAWIEGDAVLGACLSTGGEPSIPGKGQTELLLIVDVEPDGKAEVVFGATSVSMAFGALAVYEKKEGLVEVTLPDGGEFLLVDGLDDFQDHGPTTGLAWGCEDWDDDGLRELVQVTARLADGDVTWTKRFYGLRGGVATPLGKVSGTAAAPPLLPGFAQTLTDGCSS